MKSNCVPTVCEQKMPVRPLFGLQDNLNDIAEMAESISRLVVERVGEIIGLYPEAPCGSTETPCGSDFLSRARSDSSRIRAALAAISEEMNRL
uniref:Uncharacterized protein n=1 Tax=Desulfovibrio sp. U5L TaxID=596152 RepID=I2Q032_9BACT